MKEKAVERFAGRGGVGWGTMTVSVLTLKPSHFEARDKMFHNGGLARIK